MASRSEDTRCQACNGTGEVPLVGGGYDPTKPCPVCAGVGSRVVERAPPSNTRVPPVEVGFKAAWDVWRTDAQFDALEPEIKAAIRCGFAAGWVARGAVNG